MSARKPPIFCAIDTPDILQAEKLCSCLVSTNMGIKLGLEFFNAQGIQGLRHIQNAFLNNPLFIDLKYHDIPHTVAGAIKALTHHIQPAYLTLHASGGEAMMKAAKEVCPPETKLLAVTLLTSLDEQAIAQIGYQSGVQNRVVQLAKLAQQAGMDGVVCSAHEMEAIRLECGNDFILMVPGIRPQGSDQGDQMRTMTPRDALQKGASHLVIGRPITQSNSPESALRSILETL